MGTDTSNSVMPVFWLKIKSAYKDQLGSIRHWGNLKMAVDGEVVWLKGFTEEQINDSLIQQLPFKERFYVSDKKLFPLGKKLPIGKAPSFLWTPINKALRVDLPLPNPNYFGIEEDLIIRLIKSEKEREGIALLVDVQQLKLYVEQAAAIRLKSLSWVLIGKSKALVVGTPLLPLPGTVFWKDNKFLMPLGRRFELPILSQFIQQKIDPVSEHWILWNDDGSYIAILQDDFVPLTISSLRVTLVMGDG